MPSCACPGAGGLAKGQRVRHWGPWGLLTVLCPSVSLPGCRLTPPPPRAAPGSASEAATTDPVAVASRESPGGAITGAKPRPLWPKAANVLTRGTCNHVTYVASRTWRTWRS